WRSQRNSLRTTVTELIRHLLARTSHVRLNIGDCSVQRVSMGISTGCRIHAWSKTIRVYLGAWYLCSAGVAVALGQCCGSFVVRAYYQGTIWTDLRRKVCKYLVDGRFSPVIVQVISFNIGDDRNIWGVVQQR